MINEYRQVFFEHLIPNQKFALETTQICVVSIFYNHYNYKTENKKEDSNEIRYGRAPERGEIDPF